jgi:pyruvate,water dikinase
MTPLLPGSSPSCAVSAAEAGGKGHRLLRLREAGFRVPAFCILPAAALQAVLDRESGLLRAALAGLDGGPGPLRAASARTRDLLLRLSAELPGPDLVLEALGCARLPRLAVRSSAPCEDGARASHAGLYDSLLDVEAADLAAAIRRVWASAAGERVLAYRLRQGLDPQRLAMAVVIQEMVDASVSGVLFSREAGSTCCVIAAAEGLGEGVVAGTAASHAYRVERDADRIECETGQAGVLGDAQLRELRDLGLAVEQALGGAQDVEWSFDRSGCLWVLQARPITALPGSRHAGRRRVWESANVVESYPGVTRALTFSFIRQAYASAFAGLARRFLPVGPRPGPEVTGALIGLQAGRVHYNLAAWYRMLAYLPGARAQRATWDRLIGVSEGEALEVPRAALPARLLAGLVAAAWVLRIAGVERAFARRSGPCLARHAALVEAAATPDELVAVWRSLSAEASAFWDLTLVTDFQVLQHHRAAAALWRRLAGASPLPPELLAGPRPLESVAPLRSALALAGQIGADPAWRAAILAGEPGQAWRRCCDDPALDGLHAALQAHLLAFGDRCPQELKLEERTFREEPALLVELLRRFLREGASLRQLDERERRAREAGTRVLESLHGPLGALLRLVVARTRRAVAARESMRLRRGRLYGVVRRLFSRLGEQLAAAGLLDDRRDVFDLTIKELVDVVEGTAVTRDLRGLCALRRAELERQRPLRLPARFETLGLAEAPLLAVAEAHGEARGHARGVPAAGGRIEGRARVLRDPEGASIEPGAVLVVPSTDPGWIFLMLSAGGLVVEQGSLLSHAAVIGRELGIPTVVGVPDATRRVPEGARVRLDGSSGEVAWA